MTASKSLPGLAWAATQARRVIHDNDVDRLKQLLSDYPALLSWQSNDTDSGEGARGGLLGIATSSVGDSFDPDREQYFTRAACAELLIDAGAVGTPSVLEGLLVSRTRGLLRLFERKGLLRARSRSFRRSVIPTPFAALLMRRGVIWRPSTHGRAAFCRLAGRH